MGSVRAGTAHANIQKNKHSWSFRKWLQERLWDSGWKSQLGQDHKGPALPRCPSRDTGEQPRKGGDLLGLESLGKWRQRHCIKLPDERKQSCLLRWWRRQQQGWQWESWAASGHAQVPSTGPDNRRGWGCRGWKKGRAKVSGQVFSLSGNTVLTEIWIWACGTFGATMKNSPNSFSSLSSNLVQNWRKRSETALLWRSYVKPGEWVSQSRGQLQRKWSPTADTVRHLYSRGWERRLHRRKEKFKTEAIINSVKCGREESRVMVEKSLDLPKRRAPVAWSGSSVERQLRWQLSCEGWGVAVQEIPFSLQSNSITLFKSSKQSLAYTFSIKTPQDRCTTVQLQTYNTSSATVKNNI